MEILTEARLQRQAPEIDGRLLINDGVAARNAVVEVEITEAHPYDLVGRVVRVLPSPSPATTLSLPVLP
jgi:ribosomal protein S12 methylthiotransferase